MPKVARRIIPNRVFLGVPWKNERPKYERIISKLRNKFPLHFAIVGRDDPQDATALFEVIKERISTSSHAIFDATRGNPNVSLEYGYAEGIRASRSIYLSGHKAARRTAASGPIISDLSGMRRVQYNTVKMLSIELHRFCKGHEYTQRFESALTRTLRGETGGAKK